MIMELWLKNTKYSSAVKKRVVIGAYDSISGKIAVAHSGAPIASAGVHPELLNRASRIGECGEITKYGNRLGVCAEFIASNQLVIDGSHVQFIRFTPAIRQDKLIPTHMATA